MCDAIAGVTTALTVIPQGIGYAPLAGLPLQYGLYCSVVPGFVYCLFGTIRFITQDVKKNHQSIFNFIMQANNCWANCCQLLDVLQLCRWISLQSGDPVILGGADRDGGWFLQSRIYDPIHFKTCVVSIYQCCCNQGKEVERLKKQRQFMTFFQIVTACIKGFFGLKFPGRGFLTNWRGLFENILDVNVYDMTAALCCMIILYCLRVSRWVSPRFQ